MKMNKKLFLFLYGIAEKYKCIRIISVAGTRLSYYIFAAAYAAFAVVLFIRKGSDARGFFLMLIRYAAVPFFALAFNTVLRRALKKERPFKCLGTQSLIGDKKTYSFPSNHSASAMVIAAASVYALGGLEPLSGVIFFLAFLTGLSRVMTGVHYPADVFCGWLTGGIIGMVGFFVL